MTMDVLGNVIDELLVMDQRAFIDLVDKDIRSDRELDPMVSVGLRSRDVTERWYQALVRMKKQTELTLAAKAIDDKANRLELEERRIAYDRTLATNPPELIEEVEKLEEKRREVLAKVITIRQQYLRWRAGAVRFLTGVEDRLTEANYYRRVHFAAEYPARLHEERDHLAQSTAVLQERVAQLEAAIEAHQKSVANVTKVGAFGRITSATDGDSDARPVDAELWAVLTRPPD